jgi:hypothetical protein
VRHRSSVIGHQTLAFSCPRSGILSPSRIQARLESFPTRGRSEYDLGRGGQQPGGCREVQWSAREGDRRDPGNRRAIGFAPQTHPEAHSSVCFAEP